MWNLFFFFIPPFRSLALQLSLFLRNPEAKGGKLGFAAREGKGGGAGRCERADIRSITTEGGEGGGSGNGKTWGLEKMTGLTARGMNKIHRE